MSKVFSLSQIKNALKPLDISCAIENGFTAYSRGEVVVPPVGELLFDDPPGDTHIKYGYIKGAEHYVIKIASGFYKNPLVGLPSSSGLMLVFSQKTGALDTILLDEGFLTDVRTAVAGQIAAKYLAPDNVECIGIVGTGIQAHMQLEYLKPVTDCKQVIVWGRSTPNLQMFKSDMEGHGFEIAITTDAKELTSNCNLIVTTTPSEKPVIMADWVKPGTHITAMGSDISKKQELDSKILALADIVVADSLVQCRERGEIYRALQSGDINEAKPIELGAVIATGEKFRQTANQVSIADLTGVAIQDVQIATAVCEALAGLPE